MVDPFDNRVRYPHRAASEITSFQVLNWTSPGNRIDSVGNLQSLLDEIGRTELRVNSRYFREFVFALPREGTDDQRAALANRLASAIVEKHNVALVIANHEPPNDKKGNYHGHLLMTTRRLEVMNGKCSLGKKVRKMDRKSDLFEARLLWEKLFNRYYKSLDMSLRVSCKSNAERGFSALPTIHVGPASNLEKSDRNEINRVIRQINSDLEAHPGMTAEEMLAQKRLKLRDEIREAEKSILALANEAKSKAPEATLTERQKKQMRKLVGEIYKVNSDSPTEVATVLQLAVSRGKNAGGPFERLRRSIPAHSGNSETNMARTGIDILAVLFEKKDEGSLRKLRDWQDNLAELAPDLAPTAGSGLRKTGSLSIAQDMLTDGQNEIQQVEPPMPEIAPMAAEELQSPLQQEQPHETPPGTVELQNKTALAPRPQADLLGLVVMQTSGVEPNYQIELDTLTPDPAGCENLAQLEPSLAPTARISLVQNGQNEIPQVEPPRPVIAPPAGNSRLPRKQFTDTLAGSVELRGLEHKAALVTQSEADLHEIVAKQIRDVESNRQYELDTPTPDPAASKNLGTLGASLALPVGTSDLWSDVSSIPAQGSVGAGQEGIPPVEPPIPVIAPIAEVELQPLVQQHQLPADPVEFSASIDEDALVRPPEVDIHGLVVAKAGAVEPESTIESEAAMPDLAICQSLILLYGITLSNAKPLAEILEEASIRSLHHEERVAVLLQAPNFKAALWQLVISDVDLIRDHWIELCLLSDNPQKAAMRVARPLNGLEWSNFNDAFADRWKIICNERGDLIAKEPNKLPAENSRQSDPARTKEIQDPSLPPPL